MIAARADWKIEPFTDGLPLPYVDTFDAAEHARLRDGLIPRMMEDKWFVFHEAPHLYFHRSWTGRPVYRVALAPQPDGGATVAEALVNGTTPLPADAAARQAALLAYLVRALILAQPHPFPH